MDERIVDFNELKNKARDKDIDKFESYMYDLYFQMAQGSLSMFEFSKKIQEYMNENNISQEKFFNIQKEMLNRYGISTSDIEGQLKNMGFDPKSFGGMSTGDDYEKVRKTLSFQEKYKARIGSKVVTTYKIKNDLNDIEIHLDGENILIKSPININMQDNELNEFLCSYKKTLDNKVLNIELCSNTSMYNY